MLGLLGPALIQVDGELLASPFTSEEKRVIAGSCWSIR